MTVFLWISLLYLTALIGVGAWKARGIRTQEDFSLAGRKLTPVVLFGTLLATWIGTGSIFGNAEETYRVGAAAFLLPLGGVLGVAALAFLAGRARETGAMTVQDVLEARFGPVARILGTITLLSAYLIIVSYQYRAGAAVVERILPMGDFGSGAAIVFVALFVILYTALAGLYSVAYTDVANGIVMTIGIFAGLWFVVARGGGVSETWAMLPDDLKAVRGVYGAREMMGILLPPFLLLLGDANMYQRFFGAKEAGGARRATWLLLIGIALIETAIIALALAGRAHLPGIENPGHVILGAAFELMPPVLGAILVAAILAVIISTADSYLLAPATALVRDVYHRFLRPDASQESLVLAGRVAVVALGGIALLLAFQSQAFFRIALYAYTLYGVGITPALVAALTWKGATPAGAVSSMATGLLLAICWRAFDLGASTGWDAVVPCIAAATAVLIVVSLATRSKSRS